MTSAEIALVMMGLFVASIMLGFPIWATLMAMGVFFGYYAMGDRIFYLLTQNTFSILSNDVLTAVPLFLVMGYIVERANILDRLFFSIQVAARRIPGSMAVATLLTCAFFATATGIVGAVVTLMGLLAFIEQSGEHEAPLQAMRLKLRDSKRVATAVEFGPRFLHSTGQAYKGGPDTGVFVVITGEPVEDLKIPGRTISFGTVERAQAIGDPDALRGQRAPQRLDPIGDVGEEDAVRRRARR